MSFFDDSSLAFLPSGAAGKDGKAYSIKPVPVYGAELVTNGSFSTDSDWTKGTGWSISGGVATHTGVQSLIGQENILTIGKTYKITFDLSGANGSNYARLLTSQYPNGGNYTSDGIITVYTITNIDDVYIYGVGNISIDNVSVKEVLVGDGDFTFSRGSNLSATRIGSDGLIEKGRENLLTYSNGFNSWGQTGVSVTSGQSGYDNTNDAWLLTTSAVAGYINRAVVNSGVQTFSIYAKAGTETGLFIRLNGGNNPRCFFDLTNGLVGSDSGGVVKASIEDVGGGWYRCSIVCNDTSTDARVYVASSGGFPSTGNIYIQDAQLEIGLAASDYIESGASTGKAGLLEDEPRFDYSGGATCPSLLLEPSRTQLLPYSEYFGAWTIQSGITLTPNTDETLSPEGLNNAYKIVSTIGTTGFYFAGLNSTAASIRSIYLKGSAGGETLVLKDPSGYGGATNVVLTTEWQRFEHSTSNTGDTYQGLWVDDISVGTIYAYAAQWEEGSYPTSYIPNHSGGTITRGADDCTGAGDASTFNDSEGVLYAEISALANDGTFRNISVSNGTTAQAIRIYYRSNDDQITFLLGSSSGGGITTSIPSATDYIKVAAKYDTDTIKLFVNGALINTISSLTMPTGLQQLDFNIANVLPFYGNAKQVLYFPTALSDADCITLTT